MSNHQKTPGSGKEPSMLKARTALDRMKFEIAGELGIHLRRGGNGDLPSRVAGHMVKRMIEDQEKAMSNPEQGTNR